MPQIIVIPRRPETAEPNGFAVAVDTRPRRECITPGCGEMFLGNFDKCPKHRTRPKVKSVGKRQSVKVRNEEKLKRTYRSK